MLIESTKHRREDLAAWWQATAGDALRAVSPALTRKEEKAMAVLRAFAAEGPCYAGMSWGKDSTVLGHLVARSGCSIPMYRVIVRPLSTPGCDQVRDAFLEQCAAMGQAVQYEEITIWCRLDEEGWHATGTLEAGFAEAVRRCGSDRHISGVRGAESGTRKRCMMRLGTASERTCRPIGWWTDAEVFAYLHKYDLPIHPNYAMSLGGRLDRGRLRVASLGGKRGSGMGRSEWENAYYRREVEALERGEDPWPTT